MKRIVHILLLTVLLGLAGGCVPVRVHFDYEPRPDWSAYQTYNFYPDMDTGLSELDSRRLLEAMEQALRQQGYQQAEEPDFWIDAIGEVYEDLPRSQVGVGLGGGGRGMGGGVSVGIPVAGNNLKRRITFNILDAATKSLIWQGVATDSFREDETPQAREARMLLIAQKVFAGFPPKR